MELVISCWILFSFRSKGRDKRLMHPCTSLLVTTGYKLWLDLGPNLCTFGTRFLKLVGCNTCLPIYFETTLKNFCSVAWGHIIVRNYSSALWASVLFSWQALQTCKALALRRLYQFLCCIKPAGYSLLKSCLCLAVALHGLLSVMPSPSGLILHLM